MLFKSYNLLFILFVLFGTSKINPQSSVDRPQPIEVPQSESKEEKPEDLNASFFYWVGEYKKLATYKKETDKKIIDLINKYNTDISLLLNENKLLEQVIYEKEKLIKDYKIQSEKDRETIERLEAELKALRGAKDKAERSFSDTSIQLDSKIKEIESKNKEISDLKKIIETKTQAEKQLSERVAKSEADLKNLQKQLEDAQKALQMEKASSEKVREDLKSLQSQTGELQKTILSQKEALDKDKTELENLKNTIKNLEAKNLEIQNLLQMEKYKTEVLTKDLQESQKKSNDQQKQINELQKQLSNLQTLMQAEKQSYEKQIIDLGSKEKEFAELGKKIIAYQKQITELQNQLSESEKKHKTSNDTSKLEIEKLLKQIAELEKNKNSTTDTPSQETLQLQKTISELQKQISENQKLIAELKNQNSDSSKKDTKIKELEDEKKKNSELLVKLNQEKTLLTSQLVEKTKNLDSEKSEHQRTIELKNELELLVLQLKKDNLELEKRITSLTNEYNHLRAEYEEKLKAYNQEFEKSIALIDTLSKEKKENFETIESLQKEIANLKEKYEQETKMLQQQFESLKNHTKNLETLLEKEIKKGYVNIAQNKNKIIINLYDKVCFDSGSADLNQDAKKILDKIESVLLQQSFSKIYIEGNTDDDPIKNSKFKDNWRLSSERAYVVLDYILDKNRLKPEKFSIIGNSRYNPLKGLDKSLNRRVDIILVP